MPAEWSRWIAANRNHMGMNREQLAEAVNCDVKSVANWEGGKVIPNKRAKQALTELFGTPI